MKNILQKQFLFKFTGLLTKGTAEIEEWNTALGATERNVMETVYSVTNGCYVGI